MNKDKFFYLHIPKTAGSSMNKFLSSQFEEGEVLTHIESSINFQNEDDVIKADECKMLSGHVQIPQMQHKLKVFETRQTMATFRIPIEHVVSHITWVRKLGDASEKNRLMQHNETVQKIVAKLLDVDLSQSNELEELIFWLEQEKIYLFHDTQTRYLCGGPAQELSPQHVNNAISNVNKIDFVGTTERLDEFISLLCHRNAWTIKMDESIMENKNPNNYGLDMQDAETRKVLQRLIKWDNLVYDVARRRFIEDMHDYLAELEKAKWPRFSTVRDVMVKNIYMDVKK
jgi:hypothetical protein